MKTSLTVLVLVLLLLSILAGCAPGPNPSRKMATEHGEFAGFGLGLWQGFIAPLIQCRAEQQFICRQDHEQRERDNAAQKGSSNQPPECRSGEPRGDG